jgi:hypothetical protein
VLLAILRDSAWTAEVVLHHKALTRLLLFDARGPYLIFSSLKLYLVTEEILAYCYLAIAVLDTESIIIPLFPNLTVVEIEIPLTRRALLAIRQQQSKRFFLLILGVGLFLADPGRWWSGIFRRR